MKSFEIDGIEFVIDVRPGPQRGVSEGNRFILVKNEQCLSFYREWNGYRPKEILEMGLFQGGSMVLMDKLFQPRRLAGIDIRREPIEALEAYRADKPHIDIYYARSQDQPGTLMAARKSFPTGIDMVVDDASHLYEQTKATFQMLFPLLRPGGYYVIEDWQWSLGQIYQTDKGPWYDKPALANLIMELVLMAGRNRVFDRIEVLQGLVCIRKGRGMLTPESFDLAPVLRGRRLDLI